MSQFHPSESADVSHHFYGFSDDIIEVVLHEPGTHSRKIPEAIIHDIWFAQKFHHVQLTTTAGERVSIWDPGQHNTDSGPDFVKAHLKIGDIEWYGDIEIHAQSSEWHEHKHNTDPRYNSTILHVSLNSDIWTGRLIRNDGSLLPEIVLAEFLEEPVRRLVYSFYSQKHTSPACAKQLKRVPRSTIRDYLQLLASERLESKKSRLEASFLELPDLEELLHRMVLTGLGYSKNAAAMLSLAERIPLSIIRRIPSLIDLEALHLGVAGLIPLESDLKKSDRETFEYVYELRHRFKRINEHLHIPVMTRTSWQFFRLRPANFPPIRIAQAVALMRQDQDSLFSGDSIWKIVAALKENNPIEAVKRLFTACPSAFWNTHVHLEKSCRLRSTALGTERIFALYANAVIPVVLLYGEQNDCIELAEKAISFLKLMPVESDEVTRTFRALGIYVNDAFTSQGLHQLFSTRCKELHCLNCTIGKNLLGVPHCPETQAINLK